MTTKDPAIVGNCAGCDRPMIKQRDYLGNREEHAGRAYHMGHRLCSTCHGRASRAGTLPFPAPPVKKPATGTALWWLARSEARQHMKRAGFAQTPRTCKHDNGTAERRVIHNDSRGYGNRTVKKECRSCGLHLAWDEPDNPAPCTAQELAAYQAPPPPVQPWTWGVMRYRRLNKWTVLATAPTQCPQGHTLDHATLAIGPWSRKHRSRTYTCRACYDFDPYVATWRPRAAKPR